MQEERRRLAFHFTGRASEYFRIWIIGVALSMLTLGIYSAWAKVRTQQYFYRHTWLDGSSFEYNGEPLALLRGRLLIAAGLVLSFVLQVVYAHAFFGALLLVAAMPWVVVQSVGFRARSSTFRNVSFRLTASLREAHRRFFKTYLITFATCWLAYPEGRWRRTWFIVRGLRYGTASVSWSTLSEAYYKLYLRAVGLFLVVFVLQFVGGRLHGNLGMALRLLSYVALLLPMAFLRAGSANLLYGGMSIGPHWLESRQRFWPLAALYATNTLAVLATLGLAIPWAQVRLTRYRVESLVLGGSGSLDVESAPAAERTGYGEAAADLGGTDLGIG